MGKEHGILTNQDMGKELAIFLNQRHNWSEE